MKCTTVATSSSVVEKYNSNDSSNNNNNNSNNNWRASVASETLTGVTQSKIGDVYLFVYMYGRT